MQITIIIAAPHVELPRQCALGHVIPVHNPVRARVWTTTEGGMGQRVEHLLLTGLPNWNTPSPGL